MTPIQACKETKELWTEMARFAREEGKQILKKNVLGPWQVYKYNCPCCQYTKFDDCFYCPMRKEWTHYSGDDDAPCEGFLSPYHKWRVLYKCLEESRMVLCIDVEFFCLLIAEMAEEAEKRYRDS